MSPSLRGSGLKLESQNQNHLKKMVSLFTREWIEINAFNSALGIASPSPSLRGSGLK